MDFRNFVSRLGSEIILREVNYFPAQPEEGTDLHTHFNRVHLTCVAGGYGVCTVWGNTWKLTPGTVHVVLPGEAHEYCADADKPYHIYFLHFDWFGKVPDELPRRMKIPHKQRRDFFRKLHELSQLYLQPTAAVTEFRKYGLMLLVMGELIRFAEENGGETLDQELPSGGSDHKLNTLMRSLYGPPFSFPGLDALAEECRMSRRKLIDMFRRYTGMSVKQYYLRNVMRYAESMFASGEFKAKDIARQCGYSNPQNFIFAYRRFQNEAKTGR